MSNEVSKLAQELIRCGNGADSNAAVQKLLNDSILKCSPKLTSIDAGGTTHSLAISGDRGPLILFLGHSDVVSCGDESLWQKAPFSAEIDAGVLFGRGSVDMRAATAAFTMALNSVYPEVKDIIRIGIAISGDEETAATGAPAMVEYLDKNNLEVDLCLVGEPSSIAETGDQIRIGRRGSLTGNISFSGSYGHTAYLGSKSNVLHTAIAAARALIEHEWVDDPEPWPKVNFHIANFSSGTGEINVIPASAQFQFNIRFGPSLNREEIIAQVEKVLSSVVSSTEFKFSCKWTKGCKSYFTECPQMPTLVAESVKKITGALPAQSVDGGTSDGRFFSLAGIPTVEVGSPAKGLHEVNEQIKLSDLQTLLEVYKQILRDFAAKAN